MSAALDTLGAEIRAARGARTMREVCAAADISLGYLCDIEYGRRACQIHAPRASIGCGAAGPRRPSTTPVPQDGAATAG